MKDPSDNSWGPFSYLALGLVIPILLVGFANLLRSGALSVVIVGLVVLVAMSHSPTDRR